MNSIRTPKIGKTATSRRIAQAVDNEEWQEYRLRLKGQTTFQKLIMLRRYYLTRMHAGIHALDLDCDVCIRVDNYIKALCRGGQLEPGANLDKAISCIFKLKVVK